MVFGSILLCLARKSVKQEKYGSTLIPVNLAATDVILAST
jgi:hypothetical protein